MELEIDQNIFFLFIGIFIVAVAIAGFLFLSSHGQQTQPPTDLKQQLESLANEICSDEDAIQMYIQNPLSTHPRVLSLKQKIAQYNTLVDRVKTSSSLEYFSLEICGKEVLM